MWSILSVFLLVLVTLFGEYLCEDPLQIGGHFASNVSNSTSNNQEWPALGQRQTQTSSSGRSSSTATVNRTNNSFVQSQIRTFSNVGTSTLNHKTWPGVAENEQISTSNNNQNNFNNNNQNWQRSGNNSFVQSQIDRWNSHYTPNHSYASSVNNQGVRSHQTNLSLPFTGVQFESRSENGNLQHTSSDKRANVIQVTDNELREFSENLLLKDDNNAAKYVRANFQGRTTSRSRRDEAPLPLLSINKDAYDIPTIAKLIPLYDNYIVRANVNEDYTYQEKQEENALLKAILETNVMKTTRKFLIERGAIGPLERDFENLLRDMWFHLYSRSKRKVGSSGFEHVFLGEIKNSDVSGLHNWLYFAEEEANHRSNYLGYLKKIDLGDKGSILKFNFDFHGLNKPVGSMFIGTSPEFEMALYSTCFILRADKICPLKLNGNRFIIRTYTFTYDGKNLIGSAFPEI